MEEHGAEWNFPGVLDAQHDHSGHPEEQDVISRFQHCRGVEIVQVFRIFGPAQRRMRPEAGAEPGVQHVGVLFNIGTVAFLALVRVFYRHRHVPARGAIPDRDAVPPPELAADAPVTDVLQPI